MKHTLSFLFILCFLAMLLSGCSGSLPALPPPPESSSANEPQESVEPDTDIVVVTEDPVSVKTPEELRLVFSLPAAETDEELFFYVSPSETFDAAFVYPSYCSVWVEKGAVRMEPSWFFARMFFTSVLRDSESAPDELLDLLEPGKWGTLPAEGTVGTGWTALRAMHLKYDTWRDWVAWETPDRYYLLYGSCFDGREEVLGSIFETIAESFRKSSELLVSAPENGSLLRQSDTLDLFFEGVQLTGGSSPCLELRLRAVNRGAYPCELRVPVYAADGLEMSFDATLSVPAGEDWNWTLTLPVTPEAGGTPFLSLSFSLSANAGDETLFDLPVVIELN